MHIAFTVHKYPPESLGGTEIYTLTLARALVKLGHRVTVFYPSAAVTTLTHTVDEDGVARWQVPLPATRASENPAQQYWHTFRDRAIERSFRDFISETRPDLVHFQHVQGVSAKLIELASDLPRIATLHDYWYFCANSQLIRPDRQPCTGPSTANWNCVDCATARADLHALRTLRPLVALPFAYRNHYLRKMADQIDQFIAPSHFLREQYIGQGWPADRIIVLENGMDRQRLLAGEGMNLSPPSGRPHFGFLGSLAWQKGVHILIEAFNQLPPTTALTIYGSDQAFPDYGAELRALARHPHIRFAGPLAYDQVGAALQGLDALVVPSLWYENSPLVIQEAYVVGVPVIASRLGALIEKVAEGKSGRLFSPGDSRALATLLAEIIAQPAQLTALRQGITLPPTVEAHATAVLTLYEQMLGHVDKAVV